MPFWLEVVINVAFSYLASVGFALTINVPHRALNLSGISGTSWLDGLLVLFSFRCWSNGI